jgi:hypothetical protein
MPMMALHVASARSAKRRNESVPVRNLGVVVAVILFPFFQG